MPRSPRISIARLASTSLVFMLCDTPAPAWNGSTRKLSTSVSWQLAFAQAEHLVGGLDDGVGEVVREPARLPIGPRRGLLDVDGGRDERRIGQASADRKVADRALRLDAVIGVGGNLELAQRISLRPRQRARRRRPAHRASSRSFVECTSAGWRAAGTAARHESVNRD